MTFKELIEKYKNGTATPEERAQVERELEKYEALAEHFMGEFELEEEEPRKDEAEWKKIRGKLKKRNILLAAAVIVIATMTAAATFWSSIVMNAEEHLSTFWYDPDERNFGEEFASDLTLALEAITELYMPDVRTENVLSERIGEGRYELSIQQWDNFEGENKYCFGTVDRGEIRLNRDFTQYAFANGFEHSDPYNESGMTPKAEIMAEVGMLPEYVRCETYVSFGEDVSMDALADILERHDLYAYWAGVRVDEYEMQIYPLTGFNPSGAGYVRRIAEEKYPYYEIGEHRKEDMGMVFEEHFKALLKLTMDENIVSLIEQVSYRNPKEHQDFLDYVEKNGVKSYGFIAPLTRDEIEQLAQEDVISGFNVNDLELSIPWE